MWYTHCPTETNILRGNGWRQKFCYKVQKENTSGLRLKKNQIIYMFSNLLHVIKGEQDNVLKNIALELSILKYALKAMQFS